jgi:hypothetical protein
MHADAHAGWDASQGGAQTGAEVHIESSCHPMELHILLVRSLPLAGNIPSLDTWR